MERFLKGGAELNIAEKGVFQIKDEIGRGASCIVYLAEYVDDEGNHIECLLKEYNPKNIVLYREESGELFLDSEEDRGAFEQGLARFEEGYQKQISFRRELPGFRNETSNVQRIHSANGTKYIEMTCNEGSSYEKVQETSLHDLLRRIKELARIIGNYHNAGLLHLDIKPQNIFSVPGKCETVLLFDFDSVVSKEDVLAAHALSCTQTWAAPEQIARRRDSICEATDIFAIGAILFAKIYGDPPKDENKRSFAKYTFDYEAELFKNVNPKVYKLLEEILHRTICRTVKERYQSTEELMAVLDEAIKLADPKEPYLKSSLPAIQNFFVGRDSEIEEIHKRLNENNVLFISGVGGIGKSELVKNYAKTYREEYDAVIFAPFVSGIMSLVADDKTVPVYNFFTYEEEKIEDYYERKLAKIKELSDTRTLFIVDNLDTEDEKIQDVLGLGCNILVTTRRDFSEYGYEQMNIAALQDKQDVFAVFENYYTRADLSEEDRKKVEQIIDLVDGHTMTVELLAKQMMASRVTPAKMLEKLQVGMHEAGREKVKSGKDGLLAKRSAYEHIQALFDLSGLTDEEKYVLGNLSLIPHTGVPTELFYTWCELEDYNVIIGLKDSGWVRIEEVSDYISLHPVVAEVAAELVKGKIVTVDRMLGVIEKSINNKCIFKYGFSLENVAEFLVAVSNKLIGIGIKERKVADFLFNVPQVIKMFGYDKLSRIITEYCIVVYNNILDENCGQDIIWVQYKLGKCFYFLPDTENAKCQFLIVLTDFPEHDENLEILADIYDCLGEISLCENSFLEAEKYYQGAYNLRLNLVKLKKVDDSVLAISYRKFGHLYYEQLDYEKAEENYFNALACLEENDDFRRGRLILYNELASFYETFYEYEKAETYYEKMDLEMKMLKENMVLDIYLLGRLARYRNDKSNYIYAAELASRMFKDGRSGESKIYIAAANSFYGKQDWINAKKYYLKALEKIQLTDIEDEIRYIDLLKSLSDVCVKAFAYDEADIYKKEIECYIEKCQKEDQIKAYFLQGKEKADMLNYREAELYYAEAMDLCFEIEEVERRLFKELVQGMIHICCINNNYAKAELYAKKSIDRLSCYFGEVSQEMAIMYLNLHDIYRRLEKNAEAEWYGRKAEELRDLYWENELKNKPDKLRDNREKHNAKINDKFTQILEKYQLKESEQKLQ